MEEGVFGFLLELVGTKDTDTVLGLGFGETSFVTLEEGKNILHDNVLDIDLVLVVQVGSGELDLLLDKWVNKGRKDIQCSCRPWREGCRSSRRAPCPCTLASFARARRLMSDRVDVMCKQDIPAGVGASPATFSLVTGTEVSLKSQC